MAAHGVLKSPAMYRQVANRGDFSAAIAISYLDRQSLSVAVAAIQREILSNTEFSQLQADFSSPMR